MNDVFSKKMRTLIAMQSRHRQRNHLTRIATSNKAGQCPLQADTMNDAKLLRESEIGRKEDTHLRKKKDPFVLSFSRAPCRFLFSCGLSTRNSRKNGVWRKEGECEGERLRGVVGIERRWRGSVTPTNCHFRFSAPNPKERKKKLPRHSTNSNATVGFPLTISKSSCQCPASQTN